MLIIYDNNKHSHYYELIIIRFCLLKFINFVAVPIELHRNIESRVDFSVKTLFNSTTEEKVTQ